MKEYVLLAEPIGLRIRLKDSLMEQGRNALVAHSTKEAVQLAIRFSAPCVILAHKGACEAGGVQCIGELTGGSHPQKVLYLTGVPDFEEGKEALKLGARGYGNAYLQPAHLLQALETIQEGNLWLYPEFIAQMVRQIAEAGSGLPPQEGAREVLELLTEREREVAGGLCMGLSNKEMAERYGITERTIKAHLGSIFRKLSVQDRVGLALKLARIGLCPREG